MERSVTSKFYNEHPCLAISVILPDFFKTNGRLEF